MANPFLVGVGSGTGAASSGQGQAIAGNNQVPYTNAVLTASGDNLTTGPLDFGVAGEMGGLAEMSFEFWWNNNGNFSGSDQTIVLGPFDTSVVRSQYGFQLVAAGGPKMQFFATDNTSTTWGATGTTILQSGRWYHVVGTTQGGNVRIYINGVQEAANASWGAHTINTYGGAVPANPQQALILQQTWGPTNTYFDEVATYRTGLTAARVAAHYDAGVNKGRRIEGSGDRVDAVLNAVGNAAPRVLGGGVTMAVFGNGSRPVVPCYYSGQAPLEEIRHALEAEDVDAAFFVAADGTLTFLADGHRAISPWNTIQATFSDHGDNSATFQYEAITTDYSEDYLVNDWTVTRTGYNVGVPVPQQVTDATSIGTRFDRPQVISDSPVASDADALTIATRLLAKYKDPAYRITGISFSTINANVAEAVLARELMDKVRVIFDPPGAGVAIQQDVWIQRISMKIPDGPNPWQITWVVSSL